MSNKISRIKNWITRIDERSEASTEPTNVLNGTNTCANHTRPGGFIFMPSAITPAQCLIDRPNQNHRSTDISPYEAWSHGHTVRSFDTQYKLGINRNTKSTYGQA